jgi:hypothetical protein
LNEPGWFHTFLGAFCWDLEYTGNEGISWRQWSSSSKSGTQATISLWVIRTMFTQ